MPTQHLTHRGPVFGQHLQRQSAVPVRSGPLDEREPVPVPAPRRWQRQRHAAGEQPLGGAPHMLGGPSPGQRQRGQHQRTLVVQHSAVDNDGVDPVQAA